MPIGLQTDGDATRRALEWTLRVGAFMCFVGHGAFGIITKDAWIPYFGVAGISRDVAFQLMPIVGTADICVGCMILVRPRPAIAYWMVAWAVWTALLRPLSGEPGWETLERAGNCGVPAALALLMVRPQALDAARRGLTFTVALLMVGHGVLGVIGKHSLTTNFAAVFPAGAAPAMTLYGGWFEIALAGLVLMRPAPALLVFVCAWKLGTESLFLAAGAPVWEVVERGGSYAAPIALALTMCLHEARPFLPDSSRGGFGRRAVA